MRLSDEFGAEKVKDETPKPSSGGICTAMREYWFPDKEKLTEEKIRKYNETIEKYDKQLSEKRQEAIQYKKALIQLKRDQNDSVESMFLQADMKKKMNILCAEMQELEKYRDAMIGLRFRTENLRNTKIVTDEGVKFETFDMNIQKSVNANHKMSDVDTYMKDSSSRIEHISQNLWFQREDNLQKEYRYLMDVGDEEEDEEEEVKAPLVPEMSRPTRQQNQRMVPA